MFIAATGIENFQMLSSEFVTSKAEETLAVIKKDALRILFEGLSSLNTLDDLQNLVVKALKTPIKQIKLDNIELNTKIKVNLEKLCVDGDFIKFDLILTLPLTKGLTKEYTNEIKLNIQEDKAFNTMLDWYVQTLSTLIVYQAAQYNLNQINDVLKQTINDTFAVFGIRNYIQFELNRDEKTFVAGITPNSISFFISVENALSTNDWLYNVMEYDKNESTIYMNVLFLLYLGGLQTPLQGIKSMPKWMQIVLDCKPTSNIMSVLKKVYTKNIENATKKENLYFVTEDDNGNLIGCLYLCRDGAKTLYMPRFDLATGLFVR